MKKQQQFLRNISYTLDIIIILIAYLIAKKFNYIIDLQYFSYPFFFLSIVLWFVMSIFSKIYFEKRSNKFAEEMVQMIYHSILFIVSLSSVLFFLNLNHKFPSKFVLVFANILTFLAILSKYAIRKKIHAYLNKGIFYDHVLLVGSAKAAEEFIDAVKKYYYYGYKCIGYIDELDQLKKECAYLGNLNDLHTILRTTEIDEVFIALPTGENEKIQNCIAICDGLNVKVRILPNLSEFTSSSIYINNIGLLPVVNVGDLPLDKRENRLLKRSFDIVFSLLFFILLGSFIFPLLAIIIKLSSKGPIFFVQKRTGKDNKTFHCIKFRTMKLNKEADTQQAITNDLRITRLGKILRLTHIDELPQLLNVLMGTMSIVGPRPHMLYHTEVYSKAYTYYLLRHESKPGMTGMAQIKGYLGEIITPRDLKKRVLWDIYYNKNASIRLDIYIAFTTLQQIIHKLIK